MGKASSAKKVARAARAGGRRSGTRRQLGFPVAIGAVIILGLLLVTFARQSNQAAADSENHPKRGEHWHAAYGIFICDRFVTNVADKGQDDPLGSILGGGASGSANPLNDLLNSMLGGSAAAGGSGQPSGGSSLDVLGDLLGAGRR